MLSERVKLIKALGPAADRANGSPSSDCIKLSNAESITFLFYHADSTTGTATLTVEQCTDNAASDATAIAFRYRKVATGDSDTIGAITAATSAGVTTVAAESALYEIQVKGSELSAGYEWVRCKVSEVVNDPMNGAMLAILEGLRYGGTNQPTALT